MGRDAVHLLDGRDGWEEVKDNQTGSPASAPGRMKQSAPTFSSQIEKEGRFD
jgi:hypothetical protein